MTSHDQRHVASHFDSIDLGNVIVPLMMLLEWCDAGDSTNIINWPKSHVTPHFSCLDLRNAVVPLTIPLASYSTKASSNYGTWLKKSCCTSFSLFWAKECNGTIHDAISIMWCLHWYKWHPVMPTQRADAAKSPVAPQFGHFDLSNEWYHWQCWWHHVMTRKHGVALHFDHLHLKNVMLPLMMPSASMMPMSMLMASYDKKVVYYI